MHFEKIIKFWFEELNPEDWWKKSEDLDRKIDSVFSEIHRTVARGETSSWRKDPMGSLAEIIVLDQFSRNIYRERPESFAYDGMALLLCQFALDRNIDSELDSDKKAFLYIPLMHSESEFIHQHAVEKFSQPGLENNLDFEIKHKNIIDRFGRYPHRNKILGRPSTAEELEFLKQPGSSF